MVCRLFVFAILMHLNALSIYSRCISDALSDALLIHFQYVSDALPMSSYMYLSERILILRKLHLLQVAHGQACWASSQKVYTTPTLLSRRWRDLYRPHPFAQEVERLGPLKQIRLSDSSLRATTNGNAHW